MDGRSITQADLGAYVRYALSFYGWTYGTGIGSSGQACPAKAKDIACKRVRTQSLRRLMEEAAVQQYASKHRIVLSYAEQRQVELRVNDLLVHDTTVSQLLAEHKTTRAFVKELLSREVLIRKVEALVTDAKAAAGMSYHLREYVIPILTTTPEALTYHKAVTLATDGKPIPPQTQVRAHWVAPFRVQPRLQRALAAATPGSFVGPFKSGDAYLVVKLMAYRVHRYGRPARIALETRYFREWLNTTVKDARPTCYDGTDHAVGCPASSFH